MVSDPGWDIEQRGEMPEASETSGGAGEGGAVANGREADGVSRLEDLVGMIDLDASVISRHPHLP